MLQLINAFVNLSLSFKNLKALFRDSTSHRQISSFSFIFWEAYPNQELYLFAYFAQALELHLRVSLSADAWYA